MQLIQDLHRLRGTLAQRREDVVLRLTRIIGNDSSRALRQDIQDGLYTLPSLMQDLLRDILPKLDEVGLHPVAELTESQAHAPASTRREVQVNAQLRKDYAAMAGNC